MLVLDVEPRSECISANLAELGLRWIVAFEHPSILN
jgi:hypothetical protein